MKTATFLYVALAFVCSACSSASPEQVQKADAAPLMTGAEIQAALVGNTVSGKSKKGPTYVEFYEPGGGIKGLWGGKDKYTGFYKISGDEVCWDYEGTDDDWCGGLKLSGDTLYYLDEEGKVGNANRPALVTSGNPQHL